MLAFFVSPGAMRGHVAISCRVVWLFVLISGCWGKLNSFFPSQPAWEVRLAGRWGWAGC